MGVAARVITATSSDVKRRQAPCRLGDDGDVKPLSEVIELRQRGASLRVRIRLVEQSGRRCGERVVRDWV